MSNIQCQIYHCLWPRIYPCHPTSLPVFSRGRLLPHVVHHMHLLLIWREHLEACTVTAEVVHGAEDESCQLPPLHGCKSKQQCCPDSYSLHSLMDISPVPPATSWENLQHIVKIQCTHIALMPALYVSCCFVDFFHLPLQYWYFPSCHSHHGEQSRQAGEREQPVFVWTAKSWLPAWFSLGLTVLGGKMGLNCLPQSL